MKKKLVFFRIAWMRLYQGIYNDPPFGAGSHIDIKGDGGEVYNFQKRNGYCYGYVRVSRGGRINISRLGAERDADSVKGVDVIFFSRDPGAGGQYIVGWYKNAIIYRQVQKFRRDARKDHPDWNVIAKAENCSLLHPDDRVFDLPTDGPGQSNVWYAEKHLRRKFLEKVINYIKNPNAYIERVRKKTPTLAGFQQDAEKRKKVEIAAMKCVALYYRKRGFKVADVHKKNYGWDLEATRAKLTLLLEVKGLSGPFQSIELTPNEYKQS